MINLRVVAFVTVTLSMGSLNASSSPSIDPSFQALVAEAEAGNAAAQFSLGLIFHTGQGTDKNIERAMYWYTKAAMQGFSEAQFRIGLLYDNGREISANNNQAFKWYRKAAKQGHADSQALLGKMYFNGEGVEQSDIKAFLWWTLAKRLGSQQAKVFVRETTGVIRRHHIAEARQLADRCHQSGYEHCEW